MERFTLMETRYKELLVKFNVSAKENAKYAEQLFASTTGGRLANFQTYLAEKALPEGDSKQSLSKKFEEFF